MTQRTGEIRTLSGLTGFFEAPWVVKRNGIYHMVYDWKQGGSACTPSNYQACIGWATATSPLGPWTYQGIVMDAASATTMHPSIIEFEGQWYITYHTKDAVGGGHFRRSVAIDEMEWDGDTILPIERTLADDPDFRLTDNVALAATPAASFTEQPPMRLGAVNDGFRATTALLPPDQWGNYRGTTSANRSDWVSYQWEAPVRVDSAGIQFHQDGNWIRPPDSWRIEYLDEGGAWQPVPNAVIPTPANNVWHNVTFDPVTTTALRATFNGRPNGAYFHSVSVSEWEVYAVDGVTAPDVEVVTEPGVAPELPEAVRATAGGTELWAPVNWRDVDPADYAAEGSFTVEGRALGVTGDHVTATVVVDEDAVVTPTPDAAAPVVSIGLSGTQGADGWFSSNVVARVRAEDAVDYRTTIETRVGDGAWTPVEDARYADVTVTESGTTVVSGRATDGAGNASEPVTRSVKVDKVLPTADATLDPEARTVTVTASDALSGLGSSEYRFDTGTWQPLTLGTPVAAPDGLPHTFTYRVPDLAGNVRTGSVQVPLDADAELTGNIAEYATPTASFASSWAPVTNLNDGTNDPLENNAGEVGGGWGTWPQVGEQWVRYSWSFDVTTDHAGVWWDSDQPDTGNAGLIPPRSWTLEYLDADGTTWRPVNLTGESTYGRARGAFNEVRFEPVTTRALRVVGQSWGEESGQGSMGIREWQVIAAPHARPRAGGGHARLGGRDRPARRRPHAHRGHLRLGPGRRPAGLPVVRRREARARRDPAHVRAPPDRRRRPDPRGGDRPPRHTRPRVAALGLDRPHRARHLHACATAPRRRSHAGRPHRARTTRSVEPDGLVRLPVVRERPGGPRRHGPHPAPDARPARQAAAGPRHRHPRRLRPAVRPLRPPGRAPPLSCNTPSGALRGPFERARGSLNGVLQVAIATAPARRARAGRRWRPRRTPTRPASWSRSGCRRRRRCRARWWRGWGAAGRCSTAASARRGR